MNMNLSLGKNTHPLGIFHDTNSDRAGGNEENSHSSDILHSPPP